jgi:ParB family chromosome partitioning protein
METKSTMTARTRDSKRASARQSKGPGGSTSQRATRQPLESEATAQAPDIRTVPLDAIVVSPRRIRHDLGDLDALALSLHLHGQLAPVVVYQVGDRYHLIAGERRLEATRRLHDAEVKAGRIQADSSGTINVSVRRILAGENPREIELAENAQRRELNDEEEADALIQLVREDGREMREVAAIAGRSVAYVSKRVRMFEDATLRKALTDGLISPAQAEELLGLDEERRPEMLQLALRAGWSSKDIREAIQTYTGRQEFGDLRPKRIAASDGSEHDDFDDAEDFGEFEAFDGGAFPLDAGDQSPAMIIERPRDLTRRILDLNLVLRDLRPYQLKPGDDRALRQLWQILRQLAQAPRVQQPTRFPTIAEAETLARRPARPRGRQDLDRT